MNGINNLSKIVDKIGVIITDLVIIASKVSWKALIVMLVIAGALMMFGNEYGSKIVTKRAIQGFLFIQLASMLI
ncbi:MAG: hypothetical protein N4A57_02905 [Anaeromicrobium sp.]|jgi:hypothetical protein|uniref:hypothetical protein n=1 Tax=Anaeromicrobium sp. TaxID=1929132 RepID=UPI0025DA3C4F|nr:hypothetical protein [Anaeromicrobium sp.]MCT4593211.1 hypothetical protein [Anaeromicrobium sp.]